MGLYIPSTRIISIDEPSPYGGLEWVEVDSNGNPLYSWSWTWNSSCNRWLSTPKTWSWFGSNLTTTAYYYFMAKHNNFDLYVSNLNINVYNTYTDTFNYWAFGLLHVNTSNNVVNLNEVNSNTVASNIWGVIENNTFTIISRSNLKDMVQFYANKINSAGQLDFVTNITWGYLR